MRKLGWLSQFSLIAAGEHVAWAGESQRPCERTIEQKTRKANHSLDLVLGRSSRGDTLGMAISNAHCRFRGPPERGRCGPVWSNSNRIPFQISDFEQVVFGQAEST